MTGQDLRRFLDDYSTAYSEDVLVIDAPVSLNQDVSAVVWELAADGRHPLLRFTDVQGAAPKRAGSTIGLNIWRGTRGPSRRSMPGRFSNR